ncbi:unnamed protein product [Closterium sp. Yama58-4]|nr:unnamed protein product [Closterium sp. Yama58-4]
MGQLIYSFVARGTVVLAEYTSFKGNFNTIALQCLEKMPQENNKFTFPHGGHTLNYLLENGYAYMVLADQDVTRQIIFAFLERIKDDFTARYASKAATLGAHALNKEFGPKLKEHMKYVAEHPEEMSKFAKIKAQVAEVKGVMKDNIEKVLQRGEKMELLAEKADVLSTQASQFKKQGTEIKKKMWWENMKVKAVVIGILVVLALIIWLSICHGFTCQ